MPRNLDTSLAAALSNNVIQPVVLVSLTFVSGVVFVWSGVGDLVYAGNTYKGLGVLGKISAISEGSEVKADGMEITLSGIGLSPYTLPGQTPPAGVTPPIATPAGQTLVWAYPKTFGSGESDALDGAFAGPSSGGMIDNEQFSLDLAADAWVLWSNFKTPTLPDDAVIAAIYPVLFATSSSGSPFGTAYGVGADPAGGVTNHSPGLDYDSGLGYYTKAASAGTSLDGLGIGAFLWSTVEGGQPPDPPLGYSATVSFVAYAVYYTTASNAYSLVNDAVNDFQAGAPAQVWFGLMNNGALIGAPYLIFSGQMDQPIIDMGTQTASITISLENRLSNLGRPTARRYTTADQHLQYPDDLGFSWVEVLNDLSLRWGA